MKPSKLVLFVEGEGDVLAVPLLVKRLLTEANAWDAVTLDRAPFKVGQVNRLLNNSCERWKRWLQAALRRPNVGAILLVLDGDVKLPDNAILCAKQVAQNLVAAAKNLGAGAKFSVAVVFAVYEYETWLLAGADSLVGKKLPNGTLFLKAKAEPVPDNIELKRHSKGWFKQNLNGGYRETIDQEILTGVIDLSAIRTKQLRSFRRLEHALVETIDALRNERHVATPDSS